MNKMVIRRYVIGLSREAGSTWRGGKKKEGMSMSLYFPQINLKYYFLKFDVKIPTASAH